MTVHVGGPASVSTAGAAEIADVLGLPVVAERSELYLFQVQAHDTYALFGIDSALAATYEHEHPLLADVGLVYFVYALPATWPNSVQIECGLADSLNAATCIQGYFGNEQRETLDPGGVLVSSGFAADKLAGQSLFDRTWVTVESGDTWPIQFRTAAQRCEATNNRTGGGTLASGSTRSFGPAFIVGTVA